MKEGHRRDPRQPRHTALLFIAHSMSCYRVITYQVSVAAPDKL
ncbi:hypothetical protein AB97_4613 [Escherichia coli 1-110-08_S3_C1]|nr:hypothetical protein AB97_4613 [Escherichia coli 1-110-08_S3_C1]